MRTKHLRQLRVAATVAMIVLLPGLGSAAGQDPQYGDVVPIDEYVGLGTDRTVVVAFGATCEACRRSLPFYQRLIELDGMDGKQKRFVILSVDGVVPVAEVLEAEKFKPHHLVSYPRWRRLTKITEQAPELIVLDAAGNLLRAWQGALTAAQEEEVLKLVR